MAIDFPNSPSNNDIYTVNGKRWIYSNGKWSIYGSTAPDATASDTEPTGVGDGHIWYRSDQSQTLIRYDNTWVEVGSAGGFDSSSTNFPTSLDSATGFAAVEAIETALLDGAPLHIDDANERVGVGNVSPSYKLDVTGDINASGDVRVGGDSLPRGQVAIATTDADFTATTGGVDILNTSVTLTSSRILRVTYFIGAISSPSTSLETTAYIRTGPLGTGTTVSNVTQRIGTSADISVKWAQVLHSATYAAGTHTFYAAATTTTGTCVYNGATSRPHLLIVDDMGAG